MPDTGSSLPPYLNYLQGTSMTGIRDGEGGTVLKNLTSSCPKWEERLCNLWAVPWTTPDFRLARWHVVAPVFKLTQWFSNRNPLRSHPMSLLLAPPNFYPFTIKKKTVIESMALSLILWIIHRIFKPEDIEWAPKFCSQQVRSERALGTPNLQLMSKAAGRGTVWGDCTLNLWGVA